MSSPPLNAAGHPRPRSLALALFFCCLLSHPVHARGPDPPQRIPLERFGFQTISPRYLLQGATMVTVDYVDAQHLLVTFGVSRLMPRLADCPADDEDRTVRAVLLELPSGRELARTEWRFHDLGQYLWSLGEGRFLLRKRDSLTIFSPLESLPSGNAFAEQPFLHFDRRIQAILVSASRDLLSIETVKRPPRAAPAIQTVAQTVAQTGGPAAAQNGQSGPQGQPQSQSNILTKGLQRRDPNEPRPDAKPDPTPNEIDFIRLIKTDEAEEIPTAASSSSGPRRRILGRLDGRLFTSTAVSIPLTSEGFLRTRSTTRDGVLLDFLTFTGKDIDLGDFATSCHPRPTFVSRSEFVAFGCRGDEGSLDLAGFNLRGDFLWQINFTDEQAYPAFASAIPSGRFAFSRTVTSSHVFGNETPSMDQLQAQEVRVIQMYNGKQLLKVVTSPIQRAGQNFTLSPDGLSLAVIHDNPAAKGDLVSHQTSIEIYKLPALSSKDLEQVKLEASMAPEPAPADADVHMRFSAEEIKAALAAKPATEARPEAMPQTGSKTLSPVDSRIAGDQIPPAAPPSSAPPASTETAASAPTPASGTIPSSDPAPACANLKDASVSACPAAPSPNTAAATPDPSSDSDADSNTEAPKRRKPPTLYEPVPPAPPQ